MHEKTSPQRELFPPREVPVDRMDEILRPENIIPIVAEEVQKAFVRLPPEFEGEELEKILPDYLEPRRELLLGFPFFDPTDIPAALVNGAIAWIMLKAYERSGGKINFKLNRGISDGKSLIRPRAIVRHLILESTRTQFNDKRFGDSLDELSELWNDTSQKLRLPKEAVEGLLRLIRTVPGYEICNLSNEMTREQYFRSIAQLIIRYLRNIRNLDDIRNLNQLISSLKFISQYSYNQQSLARELQSLGFMRLYEYPYGYEAQFDPGMLQIIFCDVMEQYYNPNTIRQEIEYLRKEMRKSKR